MPPRKKFGFGKIERLTSAERFREILGGSKKFSGFGFTLRFSENTLPVSRLGIVLSKKKFLCPYGVMP